MTPVSPLAHGLRAEVELRRGPWTASVSGSAFRRTRWEPWGRDADELPPATRPDYERYAIALSRSLVLSPHATGRLEASWMAGHDLDRFSRYAIDSFLNRLRGYPAGSLRYDRGLLLRAQASAALLPGLRAGPLRSTPASCTTPATGPAWRRIRARRSRPRAGPAARGAPDRGGRRRLRRARPRGPRGTRSLQITAVKTF